ncbi:MAG: hypothetical protein WAL32_13690 [Terriglobales bacterium]
MKVIRHNDKFVQQEFTLSTIFLKHAQKQSGGPVGLKEESLVRGRGCHMKSADAGDNLYGV